MIFDNFKFFFGDFQFLRKVALTRFDFVIYTYQIKTGGTYQTIEIQIRTQSTMYFIGSPGNAKNDRRKKIALPCTAKTAK